MLNSDKDFSYQSDVDWLANQARPYYYSIIILLIYFDFYILALFYMTAAITLIWEVDEADRIDESIDNAYAKLAQGKLHRIVDLALMMDYLQNSVEDPHFSNNIDYFIDYFNNMDLFIDLKYNLNFFLFDNNSINQIRLINKKEIVKLDDKIDSALVSREENYDIIKSELMKFKKNILKTADPAKRTLVKQRMKKLLDMASSFEEDILIYTISVESHDRVILNLSLKMGLYPISEYDFDLITFSNFDYIIYNEYLLYFFNYNLKKIQDYDKNHDLLLINSDFFYLSRNK